MDLKGARAIVTGGARGIGRATAVALGRAGARVGIGYRRQEEAAADVIGRLRGLGVEAWAEPGDLGEPSDAGRLFARVDAEFGGLDILVANAGIWNTEPVPLASMTDDQWTEMMSANLTSAFNTTREAARRMKGGGKIVIVSSTAGQRGEAGHAHYAASKGALISLVKSLAVELAARGINVNAVAPGWVITDMVTAALAADEGAAVIESIPLRRIASPEDIAGPIVFLCSPLARHITGEILNINGGSVLCG